MNLKSAKEDTAKAITLNVLSIKLLQTSQYDSALTYINKAIPLGEKFILSSNPAIVRSGKKILAKAISNSGIAYSYLGNYPKSLDQYFKALKIREELKNEMGIAGLLGNIGLIYFYINDFDKSLAYDTRSLNLYRKLNDKTGIANMLNSIGTIYQTKKDYKNALNNYTETYKIAVELNDKRLMGYSLGNMSLIYRYLQDLPNALKYTELCIKVIEGSGDEQLNCSSQIGLGETYLLMKNYKKAEKHALAGLEIANHIGALSDAREANKILSRVNTQLGKHKEALAYFKAFIAIKDSLVNEENTKNAVRTELNFVFEKKEAATKLEQEKKEAIAASESKKQQIIIWAICGILILVIGFAVFAYRNFLQKQKANEAISKQKEIIEEKQKEILDSIHYAKRIQSALLPSEKYIARQLARDGE
ncbi:MAG: tetratricopeptide repeat protein [Bacteroidia bacterium]